MKRTFSTELAYVFGIVFVARGVVLMEKADFGVSMVVAPAYLLYRWLSPVWSFVPFGMRVISLLLCHGGRLRLCAGRFHAAWRRASGGQRLAARDLLCAGDAFLRGRCFRHVPHL